MVDRNTGCDRTGGGSECYLRLTDDGLLEQCDVDLYRSSGPGGQKRNKTSSAVRLRHQPTGLIVTASEERSQHVNRRRAIGRLRAAIALHVRREVDIASYVPSTTMQSAIKVDGAIRMSGRNADYDLVVGEVLDVLAACGVRVSDAAVALGVTTSHLVKFLAVDPKLWERVNQLRSGVGLKKLEK